LNRRKRHVANSKEEKETKNAGCEEKVGGTSNGEGGKEDVWDGAPSCNRVDSEKGTEKRRGRR